MSRNYASFVGGAPAVVHLQAEDEGLITHFRRLLLEEVDLTELSRLDPNQRRARLERVIAHLVSREGVILSTAERNQLIRRVVDEAVGLGILEPILADPTVSEIMINGHDTIYVERRGVLERWPGGGFTSEEQLLQTVDRIVSTVNRRVDESSPMADARLPPDPRMPRGARVNVVLRPLSLTGPLVTIRLFPQAISLARLIEWGSLSPLMAKMMQACVEARLNVVISGGTGSGKTTMLNALSSFIDDSERIVTIEDAAELSLNQRHTIRLETRPPNVEGRGQVTIRDLVRNALRMRPDRIVVGECRGGEALDMLQAMNTGHEGSLTTVHANTPLDALIRIETMATMADVDVPFHAIRDQVNSAINLVIQLGRVRGGARRVTEIAWLDSHRSDDYDLKPVITVTSNADGEPIFQRHPLPKRLAERLAEADADLERWWQT